MRNKTSKSSCLGTTTLLLALVVVVGLAFVFVYQRVNFGSKKGVGEVSSDSPAKVDEALASEEEETEVDEGNELKEKSEKSKVDALKVETPSERLAAGDIPDTSSLDEVSTTGSVRVSSSVGGATGGLASTRAGTALEIDICGERRKFCFCPKGLFAMGSPEEEAGRRPDEKQRLVLLSRDYWTMETEVDQKLWRAVTGENPSRYRGDELPVENASWDDCSAFVAKLNEKLSANEIQGVPFKYEFSLPTEAEWERARRASSETARAKDVSAIPTGTGDRPKAVGVAEPNEWGLRFMSGNVWEWCLDRYGEYEGDSSIKSTNTQQWIDLFAKGTFGELFDSSFATDPVGAHTGTDHVARGGDFHSTSDDFRAARRATTSELRERSSSVGLRLVLVARATRSALKFADDLWNLSSDKSGRSKTLSINGTLFRFRYCGFDGSNSNGLTNGFWILETETTQRMWEAIMKTNPSARKGAKLPVENVSWADCQKFIAKLNGLNVAPTGWKFKLPSGEEWTIAHRAGTKEDQTVELDGVAWHMDNSNNSTWEVGLKIANKWGIVDTLGNVGEWTEDVNQEDKSKRDVYGGSYSDRAKYCKCGISETLDPEEKNSWTGFRFVLVRDPNQKRKVGRNSDSKDEFEEKSEALEK
ncbi:MAG: SUMF1/EgtB/PvdO family nonheme iron enzyme [Thermoguttaceae bacterium]|nr:SUMF1/EgtB/PvdO family nonheme iron enzyme [Thermoguttaceae bacterium]